MRAHRMIATVVVATALIGAVAGCRPVAARSTPSSGATAAANAGAGAGGAGTVTVAITEPVAVSGHAGTSVTCTTGRLYTATAQSATIEGYQVSFTVRATGYTGAGSYPTLVTLRLDNPNGAVTSVSAVPGISADLTDTGGSFTINATGDNGRTLAASLSWVCS